MEAFKANILKINQAHRWFKSSNYANNYSIFNAASNEHQLIQNHLSSDGLLDNIDRFNVLDIGAADGDLTYKLFKGARNITAYEPNLFLSQHLQHKFLFHKHFNLINSTWEVDTLMNEQFNIISMQHILYHVNDYKIIELLNNALKHLKPNGILIVSLWSLESRCYEISLDLKPNVDWDFTSEDFIQLISNTKLIDYLFDRIKYKPIVSPINLESARCVLDFLIGKNSSDQEYSNLTYNNHLSNVLKGVNNKQDLFIFKK